jgi:hypothetical protein
MLKEKVIARESFIGPPRFATAERQAKAIKLLLK